MKRKSLLMIIMCLLVFVGTVNAQMHFPKSAPRKVQSNLMKPIEQSNASSLLNLYAQKNVNGPQQHDAIQNRDMNVIWTNSMETGELSDWWTYEFDGNEDQFGFYNASSYAYDGNNFALSYSVGEDESGNAYQYEPYDELDNLLFTPDITLPNVDNLYLSFYARAMNTNTEYFYVVSLDSDSNINPIDSDATYYTISGTTYQEFVFDISALKGQTIAFGVEHVYGGGALLVDYFRVYQEVAEEEITIGSGTSNSSTVPTNTSTKYSLTQQLYTASEIGYDGGTITSVSFYANGAATRTLDIYMVNTTQSSLTTTNYVTPTASDKVVNAQRVSFTANAWTKITFDTPFEYTGGNVALIVDDNTNSTSTQRNFRVFSTGNNNYQAMYVNGTTNYNPTSSPGYSRRQTTKNQVKFTIVPPPTLVQSITASNLSVMQGFTAQIDYTVLPADATDQSVSFTSANTSVATVDANGKVTGVATGTTTITIAANDESGVSTPITVTVEPLPVGLTFDFETDPAEDGWVYVDSDGDSYNWTWTSENSNTFEGTGKLYSESYHNISSTSGVALNPDNWAITPAILIQSSPSTMNIVAWGRDANYAAEHFQLYVGTSSDISSMTAVSTEFVATGSYVLYTADLSAYAGQIVYLAIRHYNCSDQFILDIDYMVVTNAELAPEGILVESIAADPVTVTVGQTATIANLEVLPADATNPAVTYTSNGETIATVTSAGVVTGVAVGTTTITIAATDGSNVSTTINVTVTGIDVTGITAEDVEVVNGETATISYTVAPANATDPSVTFTSANTAIATVDENGVVTGVSVGETTITIASVSNPEVTATINVTVTSNPNAVQFTVNAPATAHPGDVITVDFMLAAPTTGTYTGFTGLDVSLYFETAAFQYNSKANGAVADAVSDIDMGQVAITGPNTNNPNRVKALLSTPANYPVTTEGIVFSATFTVLQDVELGNYTFDAAFNEFDYTTGEVGNSNTVDILYEFTPSTVNIAALEQYFKHIGAYGTHGYYLIASPIGEVNPGNVDNMLTPKDGTANTYDLYSFNQAEQLEWRNYRQGAFEVLEPGKGYLYANLNDVELVFTGSAYSGNGEVTLTKVANPGPGLDFPDWNLVGNPFPVTAYITKPHYTMNSTGSEIIGITGNSVEPMEGIFVVANTNGETMTFSTTAPAKRGSNLTLNLTDGGNLIDRAIVSFSESEQLPKFQLNRNSTKLYIPQDGKDYAVVCSEEMGAMPVNFKAEDNGTYTMNFSCENVGFAYLHLIDNKTGNDVDLLQTPSYSFEAKTTDYESRFKLVFATGDNSNDDNFAFFSNGSFVINNDGTAELQVIDLMGRILSSETINGCANVNVNAAPGVYMLRLINGDNVKVQKVVVK